ncbi:MAG: hypothetical protein JNL94_10435 [Planctomycetes bacterium]|nr:hypothetical protein [Planctomycetota bacterium]
MALRYFRKNKKMTKWIYIGLTVVVMLTFSVTGSIYDFLSGGGDDFVGSFTTPQGNEVVVRRPEWQRWNQRVSGMNARSRITDDAVWEMLMMDAVARESGVNPSDSMVREFGKRGLGVDLADLEQMKLVRSATGLPEKEVVEFCRSALRIALYEDLVSGGGKRVLSQQIYDRFKTDHELFTVDYVSIADADKVAGLDKAAVSAADLKTFLDTELPQVRRENEFSTPMKFVLDAALLAVKDAKPDELAAKIPDVRQREVTDVEIQEFYDDNSDRFERPVKKAEAPKDGDAKEGEVKEGDAKEGDAKDAEADASDDEEMEEIPLAEVKDQIKAEILIERVINAAAQSYRDAMKAEREAAAKKALDEAIKKQDPADPNQPADEKKSEETPAEAPKVDQLEKVAKDFGLELVTYPDAVELGDLGKLDRIGGGEDDDADLEPFVRGLANGDITTRSPSSKVPYGFILRVKDRVQPQVKPIEEIEAKLRDVWLEEKSKKAADEAAKALDDALIAKAREKVKDDIAKREQEAKDAAAKRIETEKVTDDARKTAIHDEELAKVKPAIDDLIASKKGEVFDEVVKAAGLAPTSIPEFRKSYRTTAFYGDDDASVEKFVKGHAALFNQTAGAMLGPVRDDMNKGYVFMIVRSKREPPFEMMRPGDRVMAEQALASDPFGQRMPGGVDFSFPAIAQRFNLKRPAESTQPEG